MPSADRAIDRGTARARRHAAEIGDEFRERRHELGLSQERAAAAVRLSRYRYGRIERGEATNATLLEFHRVAAVLGFDLPLRVYPSGPPVRDAAHARRLQAFLGAARKPLTTAVEVPLRLNGDRPDHRAWDGMIFGDGQRTAVELEMRLRDVQALRRRHELKRRDDPTESFLLLIADTRTNRRVLAEFPELFADLARLRPSSVRAALEAGRHPRTGLLLVSSGPESARSRRLPI